jgi:hypothetical protein
MIASYGLIGANALARGSFGIAIMLGVSIFINLGLYGRLNLMVRGGLLGLVKLCCRLLCRCEGIFIIVMNIFALVLSLIRLSCHLLIRVIHLLHSVIFIIFQYFHCFALKLLAILTAIIRAIYFNLPNVSSFIFIYQVMSLILFLFLMCLVNIKNYYLKVFQSFLFI